MEREKQAGTGTDNGMLVPVRTSIGQGQTDRQTDRQTDQETPTGSKKTKTERQETRRGLEKRWQEERQIQA